MKYRVSACVTISLHGYVEANSPQEAEEKANELSMPTLCYQCSDNQGEDSWSTSGEFDGLAMDVSVEEDD